MFIGPTAGGGIYAWSLASTALPKFLRGSFVFVTAGILYLLSALAGFLYLSPSYDLPADENENRHDVPIIVETKQDDDDESCAPLLRD